MSLHLTQNIWAVGRNYADHAKEMNAETPTVPFFFLKSGNCLNPGSVIHLPKWSQDVHYELELAFRIDENLSFSHATLALDLTARDAQSHAKKSGQPWTLAKSFIGACPIGSWISVLELKEFENITFELKKNHQIVQSGQTRDMVFKPAQLLEFIKDHYPLSEHDLILTGTPAGVGPLHSGDLLTAELRVENQTLLTCHWDVI
ncbi:MAG: hypothetical protein A2622_10110 [Bdellovibrionales bacterium RIFCSPHIGHO2_01_FULL_40_29]|nr:MAG: hypothetical protein A2622_10110 [Bdellovibrionales bacterium RIFCSPHIGHO2_01_FULL_40_29]OFZ32400.1 MAG: hypothetical protein A3D17_12550 [Bdellovibrionales bacterium RIFCSPHIGHO2_02_FULL_40_15]